MSLNSWKLNGEKRWHISMTLQIAAPLHIGSGELCEHEDIFVEDPEIEGKKKPVDINACIKGKGNLPIIPGSTIKGKFLESLQSRKIDQKILSQLFGTGHDPKTGYQGSGGKAEFHDAYIIKPLDQDINLPYWCKDKQTYIETSTAIDRHTRTALHQSLHYTECVPVGVQFQFILTGVMSDEEAALLIAILNSFYNTEDIHFFGADNANGFGKMEHVGKLVVKVMGSQEISTWLQSLKTQKNMAMADARALTQTEQKQLIDKGEPLFTSIEPEPLIAITLKFNGPFLVNDPFQVKQRADNESSKTDHYPLLDNNNKPRLPSASFRGAIRTQAERIIRTLGGTCCDTKSPCPPIYKKHDVDKLCLACQIFGASGWKTLINIHEFKCIEAKAEKKQEFIAIDRFHGGGKDGAKFDATHFESPVFQGGISFSPRMQASNLNWGKGLLALVLRDLDESDISFGYGANKDYGRLQYKTSDINFTYFDDSDIGAFRDQFKDCQALRDRCLEGASQPWTCDNIEMPEKQGSKSPLEDNNPSAHGFHNTYQFIPTEQPETSHWLDKGQLIHSSLHSHGFYRDQTDNGEKLHHGRITCQLTVKTPLFIGDEKIENTEPAEIQNYQLNGALAIPATSLRGMVSSLAEAASNSAMRVLDNGLLSYRKNADDALKKVGVVIELNNIMKVIPIASTDNCIKLKKAYENKAMKAFILTNQSWSPDYNKVYYLPSDAKDGKTVPETSYRKGMIVGILRILGKDGREQELENKQHELFLTVPEKYVDKKNNSFNFQEYIEDRKNEAILIPETVLTRYSDLADERSKSQKNDKTLKKDEHGVSVKWLPFHLKGAERQYDDTFKVYKLSINANNLIYYAGNNNEVTEISFSSIWRSRVETSSSHPTNVSSFVPEELLPFNKNRRKISPTELLFGFTELNEESTNAKDNDLAFAGKVRISSGILSKDSAVKKDKDLLAPSVTLKALSSPKLPSPSLYFNTKINNDYIEKKNLRPSTHKIRGRKYYLHALKNENGVQQLNSKGEVEKRADHNFPWKTKYKDSDKADKPQLRVRIEPIKPKTTFEFHLDFNNLTEWELGLLCYALNPTNQFQHRLGMGKPLGLGSAKIDLQKIQTINRQQRYAKDCLDADRYQSSASLEPDSLRKLFTDTMNPDIYRALDILGNPAHVTRPVHYPQVENAEIENENFKWFVANDLGSGSERTNNKIYAAKQALDVINENTITLPTLNRHSWNGQ